MKNRSDKLQQLEMYDLFNESTLISSKNYIPILTSILEQATTFPHVFVN